ncbi:MAG: hypothetical protein AB7Q29_01480 [Vicinamibacterales bacterium]
MTSQVRLVALLFGAAFLALHLPFLPLSLEDLDSINFALGIRDYDVALHQPHPPGYPVFIGLAKALHAAGLHEVTSLALLGALAGACGVAACVALFSALESDRYDGPFYWLGATVVAACPLYWFTAVRPLSDMTGLAAALGVQALILSNPSATALTAAAVAGGLAAGIRSQVIWLTVPLLIWSVLRAPAGQRFVRATRVSLGLLAGGLLWFVPLVVATGGVAEYARVFYSQGAEDLTGVAMLATTPTLRQLVLALQYAFVWPWGVWPLAAAALVLAFFGAVRVLTHRREVGVVLAAGFGPYLAFDLLFQETITTRYALPLVVPVAYLAVCGAALMPRRVAVGTAIALLVAGLYVGDRAVYGYASMEAPAFRLLGDMSAAAHPEGAAFRTTPVLAMHRREYFDFRRPFQWAGARLPEFALRLPTPPKHEWLEVVNYWNGGGREPVWFIADPLRSDLALIHHDRRPVIYRWSFSPTVLIGGARPSEMDWHLIETPDWYLGEGWALTPETAGTAREDGKGPGQAPINGWIRRWADPLTFMIGGRNLASDGSNARLQVELDGTRVIDRAVAPGFFLEMLSLAAPEGASDFITMTVRSDDPDLAIEQFDAQPSGEVVYGFGDGWHEQEYDPKTGRAWRWSSDRANIRVRAEGHALALTLDGELEAASESTVTIRAGEKVVSTFEVGRTFSRTVLISSALVAGTETVLTIESSASYVPAESRWRSQDRRRLGLKLFECRLSAAS